MHRRLRDWPQIIWIAIKRFFLENYTYSASALAFTTLLAIVPLISVIVFVFSKFPIFNHIIVLAENYIVQNFLPATSATVQSYFQGFVLQATKLPMASIIFLFVTAILLVNTIEDALNHVWRAPARRKNFSAYFLYCCVIMIAPLVVGIMVFVSTYLFSVSWVMGTTDWLGINKVIAASLPILVNTTIFSLVYIIIPNTHVSWRDGLFGGFIAAILFDCAKSGFAYYVTAYPSYSVIYGAFAAIPIFLLWLYIIWFIVLFGALLTETQFNFYEEKIKYHQLKKTKKIEDGK